jgi:hypothetical protein
MSEAIHPLAPEHTPFFITAPGETDVLLNVMTGVVAGCILLLGVFYFRLHALPEHLAHRGTKAKLEIVGVLGLLSLFTHNHLFWIAGLLLALIPIPDFSVPLTKMADSLETMARRRRASPVVDLPPERVPPIEVGRPGEVVSLQEIPPPTEIASRSAIEPPAKVIIPRFKDEKSSGGHRQSAPHRE